MKILISRDQPCCLKEKTTHIVHYSLFACSFFSFFGMDKQKVTIGPFLYGGSCLSVLRNFIFSLNLFFIPFSLFFFSRTPVCWILDYGFDFFFLFIFLCLPWFSLLFWFFCLGDFFDFILNFKMLLSYF